MIVLRPASERGHANHGWLDTFHTFSFADYYDPDYMGFRSLRVLNEDVVEPGQGFGTHPHNDMEILTVVLEGELQHKDSMGHGSIIRPGDVQRMSAGTGVLHSEFNPSASERVHLLQIWIRPRAKGLEPSYEQKRFAPGRLRLVASPDGRDGSLTLHQDAEVFVSRLEAGERTTHEFRRDRAGWIQLSRGSVEINGVALAAGDGASIVDEPRIEIAATRPSEILLFDLS